MGLAAVQAPPADAHRSRSRPRHPGGRAGRGTRRAADHRGGHRGAAGVPGRVLPLAAARDRARGGAAAGRWRADPAQRAPGVAAPPRTTAPGGHTRMNSYDVRFWDIKKVRDTASGRWRVRWAVAGGRTASPSQPGRSPTGSWPASKTPFATASRSTRPPGCPSPRSSRQSQATSPGMSTPAPTPTLNGRTWHPSRAGRSPKR